MKRSEINSILPKLMKVSLILGTKVPSHIDPESYLLNRKKIDEAEKSLEKVINTLSNY